MLTVQNKGAKVYKAIRYEKIIAIAETEEDFFSLNYDYIEEDQEHKMADYCLYNDEYILKSDKPAPTKEEQREKRQRAYVEEADPLRYDYEEDVARYGYESDKAEEDKQLWLDKKDEIRERYPYPAE